MPATSRRGRCLKRRMTFCVAALDRKVLDGVWDDLAAGWVADLLHGAPGLDLSADLAEGVIGNRPFSISAVNILESRG